MWVGIAALVTALGSLALNVYLLRSKQRDIEAGTSEKQSRAAGTLSESYEAALTSRDSEINRLRERIGKVESRLADERVAHAKQISSMEARMDALEKHNRQLTTWAQLLYSQVVEAGADPVPFESVNE